MKYTEPKITITKFSCESIKMLTESGMAKSKAVFEAAGVNDITVAGSVNVGDVLATNE